MPLRQIAKTLVQQAFWYFFRRSLYPFLFRSGLPDRRRNAGLRTAARNSLANEPEGLRRRIMA